MAAKFDPDAQETNSDGTTPVVIVSSPPAGTKRVVTHITIFNANTAFARAIVTKVAPGPTSFIFFEEQINARRAAYWDGREVLDSTKTIEIVLDRNPGTEFDINANYADEVI